MNGKTITGIILVFTVMMVCGCTKTEKLPHEPAFQILQFEVPTGYGAMHGIINEDSNTITLQLPYYLYDLTFVHPEIKIAEGATISPASGERINLNNAPITYTVKAADGGVNHYTVKREYLQLPTTIEELSSPTDTAVYRMASYIGLKGKNIIADTAYVKILLTKQGGSSISFTPGFLDKSNISLNITDNNKIEPGVYHIAVKNLADTVHLKYPIRLKYPVPYLNMDGFRDTAKQGETFTFSGNFIRNLDSFGIYKGSGNTTEISNYFFFEIQSYTTEQLTVKVPNDFPAGSYPVSPGLLRTYQKYADTAFFRSHSVSQLVIQPQ